MQSVSTVVNTLMSFLTLLLFNAIADVIDAYGGYGGKRLYCSLMSFRSKLCQRTLKSDINPQFDFPNHMTVPIFIIGEFSTFQHQLTCLYGW